MTDQQLERAVTDEAYAWQMGAELAALGAPLARVLTMPRWALARTLSAPGFKTLERLGHDRWALCVRQGFEDAKGKR